MIPSVVPTATGRDLSISTLHGRFADENDTSEQDVIDAIVMRQTIVFHSPHQFNLFPSHRGDE